MGIDDEQQEKNIQTNKQQTNKQNVHTTPKINNITTNRRVETKNTLFLFILTHSNHPFHPVL